MRGTISIFIIRFALSTLKNTEYIFNILFNVSNKKNNIALKLIENTKRLLRRINNYPSVTLNKNSKHLICNMPFNEMVINCDGSVVCGTKSLAPKVGDITKDSFWDIWNGKEIRKIREYIIKGKTTGCENCVICYEGCYYNENNDNNIYMKKGPRTLFIEPTIRCSLDCPTPCGSNYPRSASCRSIRKTDIMPMDLFRKIIDESKGDIDKICLCNYGEPFLHKDIPGMIEYIKHRYPNIYVFTSTNGMPLKDDQLLKNVVFSGIDEIILSIDGARQKSYEKYRRGGELYSILNSMKNIVLMRLNNKPKITWRYILFKWNDSDKELKEAENIAIDIGVDQLCFYHSYLPFIGSKRFREGSMNFEKIAPFLYDADKYIYKFQMSYHRLNGNSIVIEIKNTGNIRWNSIKKPWGKYVSIEVHRKYMNNKQKEEIVFKQDIERDVRIGETLYLELLINNHWFIEECSNNIYFDCVINEGMKFRNNGINIPLVINKSEI